MEFGCHQGNFSSVSATIIGSNGAPDPCTQAVAESQYTQSSVVVLFSLTDTGNCVSLSAASELSVAYPLVIIALMVISL